MGPNHSDQEDALTKFTWGDGNTISSPTKVSSTSLRSLVSQLMLESSQLPSPRRPSERSPLPRMVRKLPKAKKAKRLLNLPQLEKILSEALRARCSKTIKIKTE